MQKAEVNSETLRNQGVDISMIGTHSFRKGIATFLSGIPQLSQFTCALAGVSVLFSQDIYWKEKVVIRCVVGLQQGYHLRKYHCMLYCVGGTVEVRQGSVHAVLCRPYCRGEVRQVQYPMLCCVSGTVEVRQGSVHTVLCRHQDWPAF